MDNKQETKRRVERVVAVAVQTLAGGLIDSNYGGNRSHKTLPTWLCSGTETRSRNVLGQYNSAIIFAARIVTSH